jgi:cytidylate kinase
MTDVVAIDGPSGSGKSTVARGVAAAIGAEVLDTGAMYRAVTWLALDRHADLSDGAALAALAERATIDAGPPATVDGRDVSVEIRGPEVTAAVSQVSAHPPVRELLVGRQRDWHAHRGCGVVEGRDIGTVVFPDAIVKVYLDASPEERARRRARDEAAARRPVEVGRVGDDLARRDALDSSRTASPLTVAADALVIDTTSRTVDDIVAEVVEAYRTRRGRSRA